MNHTKRMQQPNQTRQRAAGFSILELMIALTLGLVVIAGIIQLFTGNSRTYELVNAQSRLQENARYAFEFFSSAARNTGYLGCAPEDANLVKGLVGNWTAIPEYNISEPLGGFEANGDGTYGPNDLLSLPRTEGGTNLNVHFNGNGIDRNELDPASDIVVFRSIQQPVARLVSTLQPTDDPVVHTPGGQPAFAINDVIVVADCEQAALVKVTGVTPGVDQSTLTIGTGAGVFDNGVNITTPTGDVLPATLSILGRSYGQAATVGIAETTIFFIAESADLNNRDQPVNALWRKVGSDAPVELIQGVTNMQVMYGVDSSVDGVANVNRYQTIDAVADVNTIVSIRVRMDIISPDVLAEANQQLVRTFSKTISVRNSGV
ncbi:MAG: PilW family protein [Pseudomonadota bacterium]